MLFIMITVILIIVIIIVKNNVKCSELLGFSAILNAHYYYFNGEHAFQYLCFSVVAFPKTYICRENG